MTTATDFNATERVKAGAALLDDSDPGWVDRINLEKFSLRSECRCILGQLDGDYWRGLKKRDLTDYFDADGLGFAAEVNGEEESAEWDALEAAWRELILARRTEAGS